MDKHLWDSSDQVKRSKVIDKLKRELITRTPL